MSPPSISGMPNSSTALAAFTPEAELHVTVLDLPDGRARRRGLRFGPHGKRHVGPHVGPHARPRRGAPDGAGAVGRRDWTTHLDHPLVR